MVCLGGEIRVISFCLFCCLWNASFVRSNVSLFIPLICLYKIRNLADSRGSIKLMKINIINVLGMRCFFAKLSAL